MNAKNIIGFSAALMIAASCITSCSKITDDATDKAEGKEIIVPLKFGGEIANLGNTPLSRASSNDLLCIHAYLMEDNNGISYAYGLFDSADNINIALKEGKSYNFIATLIKDGKTKLYKYNEDIYGTPFNTALTNKFIFDSNFSFDDIRLGTVELPDGNYCYTPEIDRFYGETNTYTVNPDKIVPVNINLIRTVFGIKVITENFTDGIIVIELDGEKSFEITPSQTEVSKIFSLYNLSEAFYADALNKTDYTNNYNENINVRVTRFNSANDEIPVDEQTITFTRNMMTTLKIRIQSDMYENGMSITTENTEMIDSGEEVEFVGGGDF